MGEEDSLWRLQLVRGGAGLEATLHRRDYLDTELEVIITVMVENAVLGNFQDTDLTARRKDFEFCMTFLSKILPAFSKGKDSQII